MSDGVGQFQTTRWTAVARAGQPGAASSEKALADLCELYYAPLGEFARCWAKSREDAADLTQSFFCHFVKRNLSAAARREEGRFRTFLLACFKNFIRDEWRKRQRLRNIPDKLLTSFDPASATTNAGPRHREPGTSQAFDRQLDWFWAKSIHERVVQQMRQDYARRKKQDLFDMLRPLLTGDSPAQSYAEMAGFRGISTGALKVEVMRLRERFRERFRQEVSDTVANRAELEAECRYLLSVLLTPPSNQPTRSFP